MKCFLLGKNIEPPWNEGRKVLTRNYIQVLSGIYGESFRGLVTGKKKGIGNKGCPNTSFYIQSGDAYLDTIRLVDLLPNGVEGSNCLVHLANINYILATPYLRILKEINPIIHLYQIETDYVSQWKLKLNQAAIKLYSRFAKKICVSSPRMGKKLKGIGIESQYLPPAIDTERFRSKNSSNFLRKKFKIQKSQVNILYLGNILPSRFPYEIVFGAMREAVYNRNINANMIIFAPELEYNYRYKRKLLKRSNSLGLDARISFYLKDLSQREKREAYDWADVFLYPAINSQATDPPLTVLEAMSCQNIVIASPIQSIPDIIDDCENGLLVNPLSNEFIPEFVSVCEDISAYNKMRENARETILDDFSFNNAKEQIKKLHAHF